MSKRNLPFNLFSVVLSASVLCFTGLTQATAQTASLSFSYINAPDCSAYGGSVKVIITVPGECSVNGFAPESTVRLHRADGSVVASYTAFATYQITRVGLPPGDYYYQVTALSPCSGTAQFPFTIQDDGLYYPRIEVSTTAVDCSQDDYVTVQNNSDATVTMGELNGPTLGTIPSGQSADYPNTNVNYTLTASTQSCPTPVEYPVEYQTGPGLYPFGFPIITAYVSPVNTSDGLDNGSATATVSSGAGPFTFEWSNGVTENAPGGVISHTIENLAADNYSVTVTSVHGCTYTESFDVASSCATLSNGLTTIIGSSTVNEDAIEDYSVSMQSGISYNWEVTGGTILSGQGTNSISVQWGAEGVGEVFIYLTDDATGCEYDDVPAFDVSIGPAGIFDHQQNQTFSIYPNPSNGLFQLDLTDTKFTANAQVVVMDHTGKEVYNAIANSTRLALNLSAFSKGVYMVRVVENEFIGASRVTIK